MKTNIIKSCGMENYITADRAIQPELITGRCNLRSGKWQMYLQSSRRGVERWQRNYRPVYLTSITCKIIEILTHLKRHSLLLTRQFRFSWRTVGWEDGRLQLLRFLDKGVEAIPRGNITGVVYLDFQKGL